MKPRKLYAAVLLIRGAILAVGTPMYLGYTVPRLTGYLLHWNLLVWQAVPYVLCGVLWLPRSTPIAVRVANLLAGMMLLATIVLYVPMWMDPSRLTGDLVGLRFVFISMVEGTVLLAVSCVVLVGLWLRSPRPRMNRYLFEVGWPPLGPRVGASDDSPKSTAV